MSAIRVICGKCSHKYPDIADVGDIFVTLEESDCPLCGYDNSGQSTIAPDGESAN